MRLATSLILPLVLITSTAVAGNVSMNGSGEDCSNTRNPFDGMSSLQKHLCEKALESGNDEAVRAACINQTNVAWYQDRDNSMSDANDVVGDAMAVVLGPNGTATQAIQVCPGVYLATAHGALDSPIVAQRNNRPVQPIGPGSVRILAYPMSRETMMRANSKADYISPRLRDPSLWASGNQDTDYVFIKVNKPVRPNSYVTPLDITPTQVVEAKDSIDIHLYRGKSRYRNAETGAPDHREEYAIPDHDTRALANLYQKPQRVNSKCEISRFNQNSSAYVDHNCPTEQGTSGSSYISKIGGKNYLTGLATRGASNNIDSSKHAGGSTMLTSSSFCSDYQIACGTPCPKAEVVLPKTDGSVSL